MDMSLTRALLRATVEPEDSTWTREARRILLGASFHEWSSALRNLSQHRLVPLVSYALKKHGLEDSLPPDVSASMRRRRAKAFLRNAARMYWLSKVLMQLEACGIDAVVWKGAALANVIYPELSTRVLGDVDLFIDNASKETKQTVEELFRSLGFERKDKPDTPEAPAALAFRREPESIEFDTHFRCKLFENCNPVSLVIEREAPFLQVSSIRVYEPNAMLVHLIVHMNEHRLQNIGYLLAWILDVGFLLEKWGAQLDPERVDSLLPSTRSRFWLLRTVSFLERELGLSAPPFLRTAAAEVKPYTLKEVLRSRRLRSWRLPGPRGYVRLIASFIGLRSYGNLPVIRFSDPLLGMVDSVRELQAQKKARLASRSSQRRTHELEHPIR